MHFVDSHLIGNIESRMKDIVKLDLPATTVITDHSTPSGVSMGTLSVRVTGVQDFLRDMFLPAVNVPGLSRHLFSGRAANLKGVNTAIVKEPSLDVDRFKMLSRKDTDYPTKYYLDLELAPRGNCQAEAVFPTRVISGHTIPTGSALASRPLSSGAVGVVTPLATAAQPFIMASTAATGIPALRTTASAHGERLVSSGIVEVASDFAATTSFAAPKITSGLPTATATAKPAILATATATRSEHLAPTPWTSKRAHYAGLAEHHRSGSQFNCLTDHVRYL